MKAYKFVLLLGLFLGLFLTGGCALLGAEELEKYPIEIFDDSKAKIAGIDLEKDELTLLNGASCKDVTKALVSYIYELQENKKNDNKTGKKKKK